MSLIEFSSNALLLAFAFYVIAFILFAIGIAGKRWSNREPEQHQAKWSKIAIWFSVVGLAGHVTYFITRWIAAKHVPTANMFEFLTCLGMMITAAFIILYFIYRTPVLGLFALPISILSSRLRLYFPRRFSR